LQNELVGPSEGLRDRNSSSGDVYDSRLSLLVDCIYYTMEDHYDDLEYVVSERHVRSTSRIVSISKGFYHRPAYGTSALSKTFRRE
jgi:hypothetical protein